MNKRQAKKQFKKKYGCTPDECAKKLQAAGLEIFSDDYLSKMAEDLSEVMDQVVVAVNKVMDDIFVSAYGGFSNKSRVDEITSSIATIVNAPTIIEADEEKKE